MSDETVLSPVQTAETTSETPLEPGDGRPKRRVSGSRHKKEKESKFYFGLELTMYRCRPCGHFGFMCTTEADAISDWKMHVDDDWVSPVCSSAQYPAVFAEFKRRREAAGRPIVDVNAAIRRAQRDWERNAQEHAEDPEFKAKRIRRG